MEGDDDSDRKTSKTWEHLKCVLNNIIIIPNHAASQPEIRLSREILRSLGGIVGAELEKGNVLRLFTFRLPQSEQCSKVQFLKRSESMKQTLADPLLLTHYYKLVVIDDSGSITKIKDEEDYREDQVDVPSIVNNTKKGNPGFHESGWDPAQEKSPGEGLTSSSGFCVLFSTDVETALKYILKTSNERWNNYYVYIEDDYLLSHKVVDAIDDISKTKQFPTSQGDLHFEQVEVQWSDLSEERRSWLLEHKFEIQNNQDISGVPLKSPHPTANMMNGELLLNLLHTSNTLRQLLDNAHIIFMEMEATDWILNPFPIPPAALPIIHHRNHFTFAMLEDPLLHGCKIKLNITAARDDDDENPEELCVELSDTFPPTKSAPDEENGGGVVHTFELEEHGTLKLSLKTSPVGWEWEVGRSPIIFKHGSSEPPEKFCDLQLVLLKHGLDSKPKMLEDVLLLVPPPPPSRRHVILSGESRKGKTAVLKNIAKKLLDKYLTRGGGGTTSEAAYYLFVEFANVIKSLKSEAQFDRFGLAKAIIESVGRWPRFNDNKHGTAEFYNKLLFRSSDDDDEPSSIYIFLDGMDRVGFEHLEKCFQVVELIEKGFPHVSVCVTTRAHLVLRLETILKTFAYNLEGAGGDAFISTQVSNDDDSGSPARHEPATHRAPEPYTIQRGNSNVGDAINFYLRRMSSSCSSVIELQAAEPSLLQALLREYAVELMCPEFENTRGYSTIVLGGRSKDQLKGIRLRHFATGAGEPFCPRRVAEYVMAEMLLELMVFKNDEAFELLLSFLKKYYLLDVERISVYYSSSVMNNYDLHGKLHFATVFNTLDEMLESFKILSGPGPSPPFRECLKDILTVAALHGHQRIFRYFLATHEYSRQLEDNPKYIEFIVVAAAAADKLSTTWLDLVRSRSLAREHEILRVLLNMLDYHSKTKNVIFVNSHSVYNDLFKKARYHNVEHITGAILGILKGIDISRKDSEQMEPSLSSKIFSLIAMCENMQLTSSSVMSLLEFLLTVNPAAASGTTRTNYLTTFRLLLTLKVSPAHFSHQNPFFQDLYRLVGSLPGSLKFGKGNILEIVENPLKAYNSGGEIGDEAKAWYPALYGDQVLKRMYHLWLRKHEDWWDWEEDERLSKETFMRGCASIALDYRFPGKAALFHLPPLHKDFMKMMCEIGLITRDEETGTQLFFHETIADYCVAWGIANADFRVDAKDFANFILNSIMSVEHPKTGSELQLESGGPLKFKHFFVCYFLDVLADGRSRFGNLLEAGTKECCMESTISGGGSIIRSADLLEILQACYDSTHYDLLYFFARETYQGIVNENNNNNNNIMTLLFQILENICAPLVQIAITLTKCAGRAGLLGGAKNRNSETVADVVRRRCVGIPFIEEKILNAVSAFLTTTEESVGKEEVPQGGG